MDNVAAEFSALTREDAVRPSFVHIDDTGRPDRVISMGRLHQLAGAFAAGLRERGVVPGTRVLVAIPAGLDRAIATLAILRLGAVVCSVDSRVTRQELARYADEIDPDAIVGTGRILTLRLVVPRLRKLDIAIATGRQHRTAWRATSMADMLANSTPIEDDVDAGYDAPAFFDCASGRARTHGQLQRRFAALQRYLPEGEATRAWTTDALAELFYVTRGAALVLAPGESVRGLFPDPLRLHRLLQRSRVTSAVLTPSAFAQLTRAPGRMPLDQLRLLCVLGVPVATAQLDAARAIAPRATVVVVATTAAAGPIAATTTDDALALRDAMHERGGSYLGEPLPGVEIRVVRERMGPIELEPGALLDDWQVEPGTAGELLVTELGGTLPEPAGAALHIAGSVDIVESDGRRWLRTGLIARVDENGGIWLLGSRGRAWSLGGRRYWALEVEAPVADEPEVERAAICMPKFEGGSREFKNASAVLAVQPAAGFGRQDARDAALRALRRLGLDAMVEVRSLTKIPTQRRDGVTVDVEALHKQLKPQNVEDY